MSLPATADPLRVAIVGAGNRATEIYGPVLASVRPWLLPVAVCDPVREHAERLAGRLGVPAYTRIRDLVADRPMEAAVVVTPVESHHAISVYLSSNGIPNLVETTWASTVRQAREMIAAADAGGVIVRVAENFFRFSIDRFAQEVKRSGVIGPIRRVVSYADHTGYHNNSRWQRLMDAPPVWVQCVDHTMEHPAFWSSAQRRHTAERYQARFYGFADGSFVADSAANIKGFLGRHPRPGYTEWHGDRGALVHRVTGRAWGEGKATELRRMSDAALAPAQEAEGRLHGGATDEHFAVERELVDGVWARTWAATPDGVIEYVNPYRPVVPEGVLRDDYGVAIMNHLVDFALAARGVQSSEFDEQDALMSMMMEVGARESTLREGARVALPLPDAELEADAVAIAALRARYGVDPMDIDAMLAISYPRP